MHIIHFPISPHATTFSCMVDLLLMNQPCRFYHKLQHAPKTTINNWVPAPFPINQLALSAFARYYNVLGVLPPRAQCTYGWTVCTCTCQCHSIRIDIQLLHWRSQDNFALFRWISLCRIFKIRGKKTGVNSNSWYHRYRKNTFRTVYIIA